VTEAPAPVTEAPAPVTEAPAPVTEAPAPVTEAPAPVTEAPAPVTEAPAPVTEAPAPVTEAPVDEPSVQGVSITSMTAHTGGEGSGSTYANNNGLNFNSIENHNSASVQQDTDGFYGVNHQGDNTADKIDSNEALLVELSGSVKSFMVEISGELADSTYSLFNSYGDRIGGSESIVVDANGVATFNAPEGESFKYISFDGSDEGKGNNKVDADFSIKPVSYVDEDGNSGSIGGTGDDTIEFDSANPIVDGGEGLDTLVFGEEMEIDFSALSDGISNIEVINLGEGKQNVTSLALEDVLNMTDDNNTLRIDGDSSDHLALDTTKDGLGEWTLGDNIVVDSDGQTYKEYTGHDSGGNDVTLEISTQIVIDES
jgi:hypothetical protein